MANLYYGAGYKNKIIELLLENENFIKLINPVQSECKDLDITDVLIGGEWVIDGIQYKEQGHIFDYDFTNETMNDEKTFVFVDTDINTIRSNIFTDFNLYVYIFTSKNLVRLTGETVPTADDVKNMGYFSGRYANRIDVLCDIVDRILNGTNRLSGIGDVEPASSEYVSLYCPNTSYYGKRLKYKITNYNEGGDTCGN